MGKLPTFQDMNDAPSANDAGTDSTGDSIADRRQHFPATERNREPILAVLKRVLPETGFLLEIGAGSGQHAAYFAPRFPGLTWQPTEPDPINRASVAAWVEDTNTPNLRPPLDLDVTKDVWSLETSDVIYSANMIHIAPWECCLGLMAGAGRILKENGLLVLYGPFMRGGEHTAPSNAQFDASLKSQNPAWGIRDLDHVTDVAQGCGLALVETVDMPANNLTVIFNRQN